MDVVRITPRGYCHGVVEAIRIAKREGAARAGTEPVTMLGYLVHNEHVTRELEESGVALVAEPDRMKALEQVTEGTVIFTAHGISPAVVDAARARGLNLVDATCSDVTRTHDLVRELVAAHRPGVLLVTHDVEEALFLANRVIVFSDRPARIKADIAVDRPYPRHRGDPKLAELRRNILGLLGLDATW